MTDNDNLKKYSEMVDNLAWYNKGSIIELAKLAKKLGRSYTLDLAARKKLMLDTARPTQQR